jgi:hypothetical protein
MIYENNLNKFFAPLSLKERQQVKKAIMKDLNIKSDKAFYNQKNGVIDISVNALCIFCKHLKTNLQDAITIKK